MQLFNSQKINQHNFMHIILITIIILYHWQLLKSPESNIAPNKSYSLKKHQINRVPVLIRTFFHLNRIKSTWTILLGSVLFSVRSHIWYIMKTHVWYFPFFFVALTHFKRTPVFLVLVRRIQIIQHLEKICKSSVNSKT